MDPHVSIKKSHLDTLLRRAELHSSSTDFDASSNVMTVTIPKSEHDLLLRRSREYDNLKQALYEGGVTEEALETLISGPGNLEDQGESFDSTMGSKAPTEIGHLPRHPLHSISNDPISKNTTPNDSWPRNSADRALRVHTNSNGRRSSLENDVTSFPSDERDDGVHLGNIQSRQDRQQPSNCTENRTLLLKGLPERATHRDIVAAIRGGALVDVFLRPRERQASVSFAEGKSAQEFLAFTKRQDLYILDKLIEVTWNERQFYLPGLVAGKLANGASRNLIIRSVHPNLTESKIRDDLEHIHNLVVIDITFDKGNAYISTNSVHNALFARTCMMSRLAYKGMKIEYYPDECADPLPKVQYVPKKVAPQPPARKPAPMTNRFQMLNMDGANDSEGEDELTSSTSLGGNLSWANSSIAV
ncbi:hypothetical protein BDBG_07091 [Blastomyces gilchristii SLH14081]|uniref:RRM domain-containing protein n=2 Tax=Blastomyces TaxID=229219 RepID=A0A179UUC8_BLAGS|nr:uncharacterized protein BDBG_07091 [Blastomyces gilchristii SLH14081]EGE78564.1 hypothetical protein BDDG_01501 [Blastomyces dermatitidis ATCC 18188]EQL35469.1 hypothetical protein BDFG_02952 [Blastomyces dermatitidis ATCC 26199]OAT11644.1 hypothetical protein BDBG_07091 [Blastomyces gilchristii SLH14081]